MRPVEHRSLSHEIGYFSTSETLGEPGLAQKAEGGMKERFGGGKDWNQPPISRIGQKLCLHPMTIFSFISETEGHMASSRTFDTGGGTSGAATLLTGQSK
jgi:hypothetical protein